MWLSGGNVHRHWQNVKGAIGKAWHDGGKVMGAIDQAANLGTRLFGAVSPLLGGRALQGGINAIDKYSSLRNQVQGVDRNARQAVGRLRSAAPELGI
jgi:hypothetical protein